MVTANHPFGEWTSVFQDPTIADAVLDRLVHHSTSATNGAPACPDGLIPKRDPAGARLYTASVCSVVGLVGT
jgi:IstB-like ATP binding protein